MSNQCVVIVKDKKNRKEEINNTAQSLGELVLWKKIEKTKDVIDETYDKIYALQDSIDQAKYMAQSVIGMKMASIENELIEINNIKHDVDAYVAEPLDQEYGERLNNLYKHPDVAEAARELADKMYFAAPLPGTSNVLEQRIADNRNFRLYLQEFVGKRATQAAHTYRKWADLYREKGMELSQKVHQDKAFAMSDYERIRNQRIAQRYITMSYEFIEKSDSILLAESEAKHTIKRLHKNRIGQYLFTKKLME
ncbi:hypothetical protein [Catalinimonas alkaloidigena]|uniref:hypothetical protein n=1 Tax=Catalinimonas alkaloidigena TaxID=1075417 RepID=UPI002404B5BE|nr:hypothetical protein [Catalinimonas alkaloidigena]